MKADEKGNCMTQSAKHVSIIISLKIFNKLLNHTLFFLHQLAWGRVTETVNIYFTLKQLILLKGLRVKSERKKIFVSLTQIPNVVYVNASPEDS